jgi:hypothetical protein
VRAVALQGLSSLTLYNTPDFVESGNNSKFNMLISWSSDIADALSSISH